MVSARSRWIPKLRTSLFAVRVTPQMRFSQTADDGATHPQDLRLVQVQPQAIFLHPLQHRLQAALKGQNSIHCSWRKGDVELSVISVLMARRPTPPDDPTYWPHVDIKQHWGDDQTLWNPTIEGPQG